MRRLLARRRIAVGDEAGLTLIEMLVAALMSMIVVGGACAMLISAVRDQPALSRKAQNVTTARQQLERMVREIRNGVKVETATPTEVTLLVRLQKVSCGGAVQADPAAEPVECKITYRCSGTSCTRTEATPAGAVVGTPSVAVSGVGDTNVFCFVPSTSSDPTACGTPKPATSPAYVGINLAVPNPQGRGLLTISDGATLRTATFSG